MDNKYSGKKVNMKEVQCYNCQGFDHYVRDCRKKKQSRAIDNEDVHCANDGGNDSNNMPLMANTQSHGEQTNMWYLDLGCINHMTENKSWFIKLDELIKKMIRFADVINFTSEGKGSIIILKKDGQKAIIIEVWYVPLMTSNLIIISQLLVKGYIMKVKANTMKVYNGEKS